MAKTRGRKTANPAGRAATLADVARAVGVSTMTVSRALYSPDAVKAATRHKVLEAVEALNYTPNAAARTLAGVKPLRFGLLLNDLAPGFLSDVLMGCMDAASASDLQIMVQSSDSCGATATAAAVTALIAAKVDGVILPPPLSEHAMVIDRFCAAGIPLVSLTASDADDRILAVHINDAEAAETMTRHLIGLGHRRIGFVKGKAHLSATVQRLAGYRRALDLSGIAVDEALIVDGLFTYHSGLTAAEQLLGMDEPPSAIFATNDDMAAATVAVAHRMGMDVPADLTVCGFDDTMLATTIWPQLTTIRQPLVEMTKAAVAMLVQEVVSPGTLPAAERHRVFAHQLVRRQSDASPRRMPVANTIPARRPASGRAQAKR